MKVEVAGVVGGVPPESFQYVPNVGIGSWGVNLKVRTISGEVTVLPPHAHTHTHTHTCILEAPHMSVH